MDASDRNDVLASNLLFASLGLLVLYQVSGWLASIVAPEQRIIHATHFNLLTVAGVSVFAAVRGALYYGVRVGLPVAKWLVAIGFVALVVTSTNLEHYLVAGIYYAKFTVDSLVRVCWGGVFLMYLRQESPREGLTSAGEAFLCPPVTLAACTSRSYFSPSPMLNTRSWAPWQLLLVSTAQSTLLTD